jgi:hypothetical protein
MRSVIRSKRGSSGAIEQRVEEILRHEDVTLVDPQVQRLDRAGGFPSPV